MAVGQGRGIRYPFGLYGDQLHHIDSGVRGRCYICPGCDQALGPVLGGSRQRHFRHLVEGLRCDPDRALHGMAQLLVSQRSREARAAGEAYEIWSLCGNCAGHLNLRDLASACTVTLEDRDRPAILKEVLRVAQVPPQARG